MASNHRSSGTAALRYANALADLATESGKVAAVERDVADLSAMISGSKDLQFFMRSPLIGARDAEKVVAEIAAKAGFTDLMKNFLLTLAHNRRLPQIEQILKGVTKSFADRRGEIEAKVESASPLSAAQKLALAESLAKTIGRPVRLDETVNAELIGGVVVTLGSLMIDDSVKSKIDRMGRGMKSQSAA